MKIHKTLPIHPLDDQETQPDDEIGDLAICGLVAQPRVLCAAELAALPRTRRTERFVCEEGWAVENLTWEGIALREILALCAPLAEARYARICAGDYRLALPLDELDHALLCDRLNDAPLARTHGAPWRLVLTSGACFTSVKWVSKIELATDARAQTAERIARGRLAAKTPPSLHDAAGDGGHRRYRAGDSWPHAT
jgi:DMSO/TMAO reductase YedYZ molybdopterin-dependent catalytic subunit